MTQDMGHSSSSAATPSVDPAQLVAERAEERFVRTWRFVQVVLGAILLWQAVHVGLSLPGGGGGVGGVVVLLVVATAFARLWGRKVAGARLTYFVFIFFGGFKWVMLTLVLLAASGRGIHSDLLWAVVIINIALPSLGFVATFLMWRSNFTMHCYN